MPLKSHVTKIDLNGYCALSGFMAHLGNTGLGESIALTVIREPEKLGKDLTLFLKVVWCKHNPEKWPE